MNATTTPPGANQRTHSAGFIRENTGLSNSTAIKSVNPKPTYAEVVKGVSPPAQSLISAPVTQPLGKMNSAPSNIYSGMYRAPALSKKCEDVVAGAAKNDNKKEKKSEKKKETSELAIIFEKQNKPIILSGGKKPQKQSDWFSDIKIVDGPNLPNNNKLPSNQHNKQDVQIIEVSPDKPPINYKIVEISPKEHKNDNKNPSAASQKTGLDWATKKPIKQWVGDTKFNHPDVYLKKRAVGDVNPYNVLSGHGGWNRNVGYVIVPKGTNVTVFAKHGGSISDRLGNAIEHGHFDTLRNVFNKTFNPGKKMPNYVLHAPTGLNIEGQPTLTRHEVLLSELLEKNMGHVLWAACCSAKGEKFSDYSFDVNGSHKN